MAMDEMDDGSKMDVLFFSVTKIEEKPIQNTK
jgi:hypothetical protein